MRFRQNMKFKFKPFSPKSKKLIEIYKNGYLDGYDGLIADGAVRSGKTFSTVLGQVLYVNETNSGTLNLWGGLTKESVQSNYVNDTIRVLKTLGFTVTQVANFITVVNRNKKNSYKRNRVNTFEIKGGDTIRSAQVIQGRTYYTVLIDEAPKCHQDYIKMAITRILSYGDKGKIFFTGNPEGSEEHWFYKEYIAKREKRKLKRIKFSMLDNWSLSKEAIQKAIRQFTGVFYERYILGNWVGAEGLIYSMFSKDKNLITINEVPFVGTPYLSIDYGTSNPFRGGLYHVVSPRQASKSHEIYKVDEYSYCGRDTKIDKTDGEYVDDLIMFLESYGLTPVSLGGTIVDPSAKSLKAELRKNGFIVMNGVNDVIPGIRKVGEAFKRGVLKITDLCTYTLRELELYSWDEKVTISKGEDTPRKENDHSMDELRYFIYTLWKKKRIKL